MALYSSQRRRGRVVEDAPLLREYARKGLEGSNPFVSAITYILVASFIAVLIHHRSRPRNMAHADVAVLYLRILLPKRL